MNAPTTPAVSRRAARWLPFVTLLLAGCASLDYDLRDVPFPVSAKPAAKGSPAGAPFERDVHATLWVHGLFGECRPDVGTLLRETCGECRGVTDFRVTVAPTFHDWLVTHLTLGLVRMKTWRISGRAQG